MSEKMNILEILLQSGIVVQLVLLLLVAASVLSWAIIIQKKKTFEKAENANENFAEFFGRNQSLADIFEKASENTDSTVGQMFRRGYIELTKIKEKLKESGTIKELNNYTKNGGSYFIELAENIYDNNDINISVNKIIELEGLRGLVKKATSESFSRIAQCINLTVD